MPTVKFKHLREAERAAIQVLDQEGKSQREIAEIVNFNQSSISRELSRNAGPRGYRRRVAEAKATKRKKEKRPRRRAITSENQKLIEQRLRLCWSPEQISGKMRMEGHSVGRETIYSHIYDDRKRGGDLYLYLRISGKRRYRRRVGRKRDKIPERKDIDERPPIVATRERVGDWEADLICGTQGGGYLLSLYERKTRYARLSLLPGKNSTECAAAMIKQLRGLEVHTITYDNGPEFAGHRQVSQELNAAGYFCKPYHSWEKGGVENYNGLVRQYVKAGTDFLELGEEVVKWIETQINERPRKCLDYKAPIEEYKSNVA